MRPALSLLLWAAVVAALAAEGPDWAAILLAATLAAVAGAVRGPRRRRRHSALPLFAFLWGARGRRR